MSQITTTLQRYPALGRLLKSYVQQLKMLSDELVSASWLWRAADKAAAPGNHIQFDLGEWNQAAALVDPASGKALSQKFLRTLPRKVRQWRQDYDDALLDVVSELLGYDWLVRYKGCQRIEFLPEGSGSPDLLADGTVVVECKHFRTSDGDRDYLANHQFEARAVQPPADGLSNKVRSTIDKDVLRQLADYSPSRFARYMFADFSLDLPLVVLVPGVVQELVQEMKSYLDPHNVSLVAVQSHGLMRPLTPEHFLTVAERRA